MSRLCSLNDGAPSFTARAVAALVHFEGAAIAELAATAHGGRDERLVGTGRWGGLIETREHAYRSQFGHGSQ